MPAVSDVAFYLLAAILVGSALAVVTLRNIVHAALFLVVVFGAAAGIYVLLNAEFIAIVQVLIYAGAVTILILFAIMLTQNSMGRNSNPFSGQWWLAGLICVLLAGGIIYAVSSGQMVSGSPTAWTVGGVYVLDEQNSIVASLLYGNAKQQFNGLLFNYTRTVSW